MGRGGRRRAEASHRCLPPAAPPVLRGVGSTVPAPPPRLAGEAGWSWGAPSYHGRGGVSCAGCDPANELNRLHRLPSLLLGFHG